MLTLLLVEDEKTACREFSDAVSASDGKFKIVGTTGSSSEALQFVKLKEPDAIILDIELDFGAGNGLTFLKELENTPVRFKPYIVVTTNNISDLTRKTAERLGADIVQSKTNPDYSAKYILDLIELYEPSISERKSGKPQRRSEALYLKQKLILITDELNVIGISPKKGGFDYLKRAIELVMDDGGTNYVKIIAEEFNKTEDSISQAMQYAINTAFKKTDEATLKENYRANYSRERGAPTSSEFIHYYARKITELMT